MTALATDEQTSLDRHEAVIALGLRTFVDVGNALAAIRDGRLYRSSHGTFEDYCRERWSMTDRRARQLITAAATLGALPTGSMLPVNERQAGALVGLTPEVAAETMRAAHQRTDGNVTAAAIQAARPDQSASSHSLAQGPGDDRSGEVQGGGEGSRPQAGQPLATVSGTDGKQYPADPVAAAVAEFPVLAYYADRDGKGDRDRVIRNAASLRRQDEPERSVRLDNLAKSVEADRRADADPQKVEREQARRDADRARRVADEVYEACSRAAQTIERLGGAAQIASSLPGDIDFPLREVEQSTFTQLAAAASILADAYAATPTLRRIQ